MRNFRVYHTIINSCDYCSEVLEFLFEILFGRKEVFHYQIASDCLQLVGIQSVVCLRYLTKFLRGNNQLLLLALEKPRPKPRSILELLNTIECRANVKVRKKTLLLLLVFQSCKATRLTAANCGRL